MSDVDYALDEQSRYRLIGALFWLGLLIFIVPSWYAHPVKFVPPSQTEVKHHGIDEPLVSKPFYLPKPVHPQVVSTPKANASKKPIVNHHEIKVKSKQTKVIQTTAHKANPSHSGLNDTRTGGKMLSPVVKATSTKPVHQTVVKKRKPISTQRWILRIVAYRKKETAEMLKVRLQYDYPTYIKYFPKSKYYSVRIGPYRDKARIMKDQQEINHLLHVKSKIVEIIH